MLRPQDCFREGGVRDHGVSSDPQVMIRISHWEENSSLGFLWWSSLYISGKRIHLCFTGASYEGMDRRFAD